MIYEPGFTDAVDFTLTKEGVLSNNPNDAGGLTKYGITQATWTAYRAARIPSSNPLPSSVANITVEAAIDVYHAMYWQANLPRELAGVYFDFAVNSGPATAVKKLQALIGVEVDGVLGEKTFHALGLFNVPQLRKLRNNYVTARLIYDADLAQHNPRDVAFIEGWISRVTQLYDFAY